MYLIGIDISKYKHDCFIITEIVEVTVASTVFKYNITSSTYYWKNRNEVKYYLVALSHVVKNLLRAIYHMETNNVIFNLKLLKHH